jgi:hypothetical protein
MDVGNQDAPRGLICILGVIYLVVRYLSLKYRD